MSKKITAQNNSRRRIQPGRVRRETPRKEKQPGETGGPAGPEPTRYGDWERNGRCIDF